MSQEIPSPDARRRWLVEGAAKLIELASSEYLLPSERARLNTLAHQWLKAALATYEPAQTNVRSPKRG